MFWRKEKNVEEMLDKYFGECDRCFELVEKAFDTLMESGNGPAFEAAVNRTHESESAADDIRREIELTMYSRALLPESRGDLLGLLEKFDTLLTAAESLLYDLHCQQIKIPEDLLPGLRHLIDINLQAYYLLRKAVDALLHNPRITLHTVKEVDAKESESDRLERELLKRSYSSAIEGYHKRELKELIRQIGRISDLAEHTADRIGIIALKRQI